MVKHSVNESTSHLAFKKIAIDILKDRGLSPSEIHEEFNVEYQVDGHTKYTVDIAGITKDYKTAIECGSVQHSKLINLRKIFDEVIVIDVAKVVEMYEYWKGSYYKDVNELKSKNEQLTRHSEWVCEDANSRIEPLKNEIESLKRQNEALRTKYRNLQKVIATACQETKESSE